MWTKRSLHLPTITVTGLLLLAGWAQGETVQPVSSPPQAEKVDACNNDPKCEKHDHQAITYFDQKNYSKALVEFQRAYAVLPTPRLLLNIGRCFFNLGKAEEAIRYYERYQQEVAQPSPENAARLLRYQEEARSVLAAQQEVAPPIPAPAPEPPKRPLYKRWWFWTASGLVLNAAAIGIGVGVALSQPAKFTTTERVSN